MRNEDQFIGGDFTWFTAVVEDINDTENLNRVKVRCHGWHTSNASLVSTENLPWATVMMPVTSASIQGNGGNHHLEVGSWVVGFFRDGPSAQDPMVMGSIATQTASVKDIPSEAHDKIDNKVYNKNDIDVVITTGGTGLTGRDITPEAIDEIADKQIPGFGEVFRNISLKTVGTSAIQSRACAVLANGKYVFALPGSSGGVTDACDGILKHQLDINHKPCNFVELFPRLKEK